jgi:hypothetical protein
VSNKKMRGSQNFWFSFCLPEPVVTRASHRGQGGIRLVRDLLLSVAAGKA